MTPNRYESRQLVGAENMALGLRCQLSPLCRGERDDGFGHVVLMILHSIS